MKGSVVAICTSAKKGTGKQPVPSARLVRGVGLDDDAHGGSWHRQVSLLAEEQVDIMRQRGGLELPPGSFGENILVRGFALDALRVGQRFRVGDGVLLVTQLGKECHSRCPIFEKVGDCIMPRAGVFARVARGGTLQPGDTVATDPDLEVFRYAVLTASDRGAAGEREDASGRLVAELIGRTMPGKEVARRLLSDEQASIEAELRRLADEEVCDLIVTTGGTGLSPRDVTPEATAAVIDRTVPGMAEAARAAGLRSTPNAMLSRAVCGLRGSTLIVNLSGSPRAAREQLEILLPVLPHAVAVARGIPQDCGR
ncbi:MAG: molybdenum cofactor synthesis domain-containing protein [Pseudomonadota bacterium]